MTIEERDTARAIQSMNRKMKDETKIDWEQRRYEIAKDIFVRCLSSSDSNMRTFSYRNLINHASECVRSADALIAELKYNPIKRYGD